jgi:hypothetical protein
MVSSSSSSSVVVTGTLPFSKLKYTVVLKFEALRSVGRKSTCSGALQAC